MAVQCDLLVQAIHERKEQLLDFIRQDKEVKLRALKEQVSTCTCKLQHTTGLLQFCIEALKETDSAAFLQVGTLRGVFPSAFPSPTRKANIGNVSVPDRIDADKPRRERGHRVAQRPDRLAESVDAV